MLHQELNFQKPKSTAMEEEVAGNPRLLEAPRIPLNLLPTCKALRHVDTGPYRGSVFKHLIRLLHETAPDSIQLQYQQCIKLFPEMKAFKTWWTFSDIGFMTNDKAEEAFKKDVFLEGRPAIKILPCCGAEIPMSLLITDLPNNPSEMTRKTLIEGLKSYGRILGFHEQHLNSDLELVYAVLAWEPLTYKEIPVAPVLSVSGKPFCVSARFASSCNNCRRLGHKTESCRSKKEASEIIWGH